MTAWLHGRPHLFRMVHFHPRHDKSQVGSHGKSFPQQPAKLFVHEAVRSIWSEPGGPRLKIHCSPVSPTQAIDIFHRKNPNPLRLTCGPPPGGRSRVEEQRLPGRAGWGHRFHHHPHGGRDQDPPVGVSIYSPLEGVSINHPDWGYIP